jgi:hypothetical protein
VDSEYAIHLDALDMLVSRSDRVSPEPWHIEPDEIRDAGGDAVCRDALEVDRVAIVALRNAWPWLRTRLASLEALRAAVVARKLDVGCEPGCDTASNLHTAQCELARAALQTPAPGGRR